MRVIDAKHNQWGELVLLVDQMPQLETLSFRKLRVTNPVEPGYLYVGEQDGHIAILFQPDPGQPWYGQGQNGARFHLHLDDGTTETLVGPFPSGALTINDHLPELGARDVVLTDNRSEFEDGIVTVRTGAITERLWDEITSRLHLAEHATPNVRKPHVDSPGSGQQGWREAEAENLDGHLRRVLERKARFIAHVMGDSRDVREVEGGSLELE